ncbi:MAG: tetratricopeptide repeat protein [Chitinivibrionia bacterium]|nr:tetratricopeptide repeat protein [Chitinivibrionia bacterium]
MAADTTKKPKRKRLKKQQIKQDSFVTYALKASEWAKLHFNQLAIGLAVIVVVIGFSLFTSHARRKTAQESEGKLGMALLLYDQGDFEGAKKSFTDISDQYSRARAGVISLFYKGECNLRLSNFSEAIAAYEAYIRQSGKYPLFKEAAIIAKAVAMEGTGNYKDAAMLLENLLKDMDKDDPRYLSTVYQAAMFYSQTTDMQLKAKPLFEEVSKNGTGRMKDLAQVALSILEGAQAQ